MFRTLNDQARRALAAAEEAARSLNHEYIGTEHILLGLMQDDTGIVTSSLKALGADSGRIRQEIERLVTVGPQPVLQRPLPLTPRAKQAIALAEEDLWILQQDRVGPEHLVIGLMRESNGVAAQVLANLGVNLTDLGKRVFELRLNQLKFVERIVRPIRASTARKRKLREELLAHLTAVGDEELARHGDPASAMQAAVERFGDPIKLTRELAAAFPASERIDYFFERWIGWRAPETATRWMARFSIQLAALLAGLSIAVATAMIAELGWNATVATVWNGMRAVLPVLLLSPISVFVLGVLYFQVRDSSYGVFGNRKSWLKAGSMAALMGLVVFLTGICFVALGYGDWVKVRESLPLCTLAGITTPILALLIVLSDGPLQIRDAVWAFLDIEGPRPPGDSTVEPA